MATKKKNELIKDWMQHRNATLDRRGEPRNPLLFAGVSRPGSELSHTPKIRKTKKVKMKKSRTSKLHGSPYAKVMMSGRKSKGMARVKETGEGDYEEEA